MDIIIVANLAVRVGLCTNAIVTEAPLSETFRKILMAYAAIWEELAWEERCGNCPDEEELDRLGEMLSRQEQLILSWHPRATLCNGFVSWPGGYMYCSC